MVRTDSCVLLLQKIERHPKVRFTMQKLADSLVHVMTAVALDTSIGGFDMQQDMLPKKSEHLAPLRYNRVLTFLTKMATTRNIEDSGCVLADDVLDVLRQGNLRERCFIFMNLMFKQPRAVLFAWILQRSQTYYLSCLNYEVVRLYTQSLFANPENTGVSYRQLLSRRQSTQKRRSARSVDSRESQRLAVNTAVPELSCRERRMQRYYSRGHTCFEPWKTGRMQWELVELCPDLAQNVSNGNDIVSGISGHTDSFLAFSKVFTYYDLRVVTLIAIVWLVGADHHSLCEVLLAARAHGLAYDNGDAEAYTMALLESLS